MSYLWRSVYSVASISEIEQSCTLNWFSHLKSQIATFIAWTRIDIAASGCISLVNYINIKDACAAQRGRDVVTKEVHHVSSTSGIDIFMHLSWSHKMHGRTGNGRSTNGIDMGGTSSLNKWYYIIRSIKNWILSIYYILFNMDLICNASS